MAGARAARRHRHHLAVELSIFNPGNRDAGCAGGGERRRAEALGVDAAGGAGTGLVAARGRRPRRRVSGDGRRRPGRRSAFAVAHRQAGLYRQCRDGQADRRRGCRAPASGGAGTRWQRSHARARRRRRRRGFERGGVGSIRQRGPGVPVGRALLRSSQSVRVVRHGVCGEDEASCASATAWMLTPTWAR